MLDTLTPAEGGGVEPPTLLEKYLPGRRIWKAIVSVNGDWLRQTIYYEIEKK